MPNVKILITGSTNGQFKELFAKAKQLHEKYGPFEVHLCVGDFFGSNVNREALEDLISGSVEIPLTTYFINGESPFPERALNVINNADGELCPNLYFLGKKGNLTTSQGMRIAFLSGTQQTDPINNNQYTVNDIEKLCQTKTPAALPPGFDILLTHEWPSNIHELSHTLKDESKTSVHVSRLATALKPRYHFSASQDMFYEREPYKNILSGLIGSEEREAKHATRFIGLGDVLNKKKQRWFYAFNLVPMAEIPLEKLELLPENITENPFTSLVSNKRNNEEQDTFFWGEKRARNDNEKRTPYVCRKCNVPGHHIRDCREGKRRYEEPSLDSCWFCLSNPKIEKHLIVSIGEELYMTLAKGPLIASKDENCKVPGTGHVLIIPVTHYSTFGKVPIESQADVASELNKYKESVRKMFEKNGHGTLIFEISRESFRGLSHAHIQMVAIPKDKCNLVEKIAREQGEKANMEFIDEVPTDPEVPYFRLELPNGKSLVHLIQLKSRFNLQFGRLVASYVLDVPERENWKACQQTEEEERKEADLFKAAFKPFDFTLQ